MSSSEKKVVLTCAQPTGNLTLGNYLGAVRNWVRYLDDYDCLFGIVDQHAITVPYVPAELRQATYQTLALYIACGLDPERCHMFVQSHVIGHTELAWVLGCVTPLGQLERMTQFKDKSKKQGETVNSGLLFYPVLMAADILLYNADIVPVGEDQKQHVELCRDIAAKFNHSYSPTFTLPDPVIAKTGARIKSLQEPTQKMSKSDPNQNASIFLLDEPAAIRKKIGSAVTDSGKEIRFDPEEKPGISNLLTIHAAATGREVAELEKEYSGSNYGDYKKAVAEAVVEMLEPVRTRYHELVSDKKQLDEILKAGAANAQKRAYKMLGKVYRKAGFVERGR